MAEKWHRALREGYKLSCLQGWEMYTRTGFGQEGAVARYRGKEGHHLTWADYFHVVRTCDQRRYWKKVGNVDFYVKSPNYRMLQRMDICNIQLCGPKQAHPWAGSSS